MSVSRYEVEAKNMATSLLKIVREFEKLAESGMRMMDLPEPVTVKERAIREVFLNTYKPILSGGEMLATCGELYYMALGVIVEKK